jgi:riboflavin kinase/FMN adenylyltransferase
MFKKSNPTFNFLKKFLIILGKMSFRWYTRTSLEYTERMSKEVFIKGKVVEGRKLGTKLGFPTINVVYKGDVSGIFIGEILLGGKWKRAAVHVGRKPTINDHEPNLEVHVLSFKKEMEREVVAGKEVIVKLLNKIRDTEKFKTLEELKAKISEDVEFIKNWYNQR